MVDENMDGNVCDAIRIVNKKSPEVSFGAFESRNDLINYNSGTNNSATMLMILISGLMAGPAVSL